MGERSQWHGHQLSVLPQGESWLAGPSAPPEPGRQPPAPVADAKATTSWPSAVVLAVLGIGALITIFVARGSGKIVEPAPLPEAPSKIIRTVSSAASTAVHVQVGEYVVLDLPAGRAYSTVVEQTSAQKSVINDLHLPGQPPQLRADTPGHATVEVMSEPICAGSATCPDRRTLLGTLDITVTP